MKMPFEVYLRLGLNFSLSFLDGAKMRYKQIFSYFAKQDKMDYDQFKALVLKVNPEIQGWKMYNIFTEVTGKRDVQGEYMLFEEFVEACINNRFMEKLMDLSLDTETQMKVIQHSDQEKLKKEKNKVEIDEDLGIEI